MNGAVTLPLLGKDRRIAGGPFDSWDGFGIGLCLDPGAAKRPQADVALDLADFTAPTQDELVATLASVLALLRDRPGDDLYIGCRAGYGRTGTLIAALTKLAGHDDPVGWTRRQYHPKAVETVAQAESIAQLDPGAVWSAFRARTGTTSAPVALYYYPENASTFIHMLLRELGIPFDLRLVDRKTEAQRSAAYLSLNPHGLIPFLVDGDLALGETAAIALHLVDRHPECGLAPAVGTAARAGFYRWMTHLTNTPQVEHLKRAYPDRHTTIPDAVADVRATAIARLDAMFDRIEADLGAGPFVLGDRISAADFFLLMLVMWTTRMPRPAARLPGIGALCARLLARPAVRATLVVEGSTPPYV
jgi:glutathione S-transferase